MLTFIAIILSITYPDWGWGQHVLWATSFVDMCGMAFLIACAAALSGCRGSE